jgi:protein-S-isoprenylcysteine O-methyltransferase
MAGRRGTGWVVAQFVLLAAILAAVLAPWRWPEPVRIALAVLGVPVAVAGAVLAVRAARSLGRSLTPFPRPAPSGTLVDAGAYRRVRHPIYAGGLLFCAGWSLFAGPVALALTACLAVLWSLKARVEEAHLARRYGDAWDDYARRVPYRLVPGVY